MKRLNRTTNRSAGISFLYALWHSPLVRSHLTLDDVDFTILAATSVLADLIPNCPPAEACRDAFTRMAKATISMCMSTTGFGVASSLGSQALDSPVSYVSPGQLSNDNSYDNGGGYVDVGAEMMPRRANSDGERRQLPKFDMNLKDLFSDVELQARPQSFFPQVGQRANITQQQQQLQEPAPFTGQTYTIPSTPETSVGTQASPLQYQQQQQQSSLRQQQQQQQTAYTYQPLSQTISQQPPPEFSFDTLDFLDTFPTTDSNINGNGPSNNGTNNNDLWPNAELDLGFGTGGMAGWEEGGSSMEGVGAGGGGPDLFDGFFFGSGGTGGGGGGGAYGGQF